MYIDVGDGDEPVMMLHGAGVSGWMWSPTRALLNSAVKAIVPDLPGFGRSASYPYVSHKATVEELRAVIESYAPQGAHIVGFSLGAQLAILLASEVVVLIIRFPRRKLSLCAEMGTSVMGTTWQLTGPAHVICPFTKPPAALPGRQRGRHMLLPG